MGSLPHRRGEDASPITLGDNGEGPVAHRIWENRVTLRYTQLVIRCAMVYGRIELHTPCGSSMVKREAGAEARRDRRPGHRCPAKSFLIRSIGR